MSRKTYAEQAKEICSWTGMCMSLRYFRQRGPSSHWPMPPREKRFFLCWAMNETMNGDGFGYLATQALEDVDAFIEILASMGAKKTSVLVRKTVTALRSNDTCDEAKTPSGTRQCVA